MRTDEQGGVESDPDSVPERQSGLTGSMRIAADLLALIYIGTVATVASVTGAFYMMFPELGALSWDVMEQPHGRWAGSPLLLAITPPLTGVIGTVVTRTMPYGFASVLLAVTGCVALVRALRSPVAPAISAGLLPLVLGITSWWYPPGILFGSALLAAVSIPWKSYAITTLSGREPTERPSVACSNDDPEGVSMAPRLVVIPLLVFVAIAVGAVRLTGMRFILYPPLVVILYEMLSHRARCRWNGRALGLPIGCFLAAAGGYLLHAHIGFAPLAAISSMAWGIAVLRVMDLHVPPALAVALLPMVMVHPTAAYPFAVGLGTSLASAWYAFLERWHDSRLGGKD